MTEYEGQGLPANDEAAKSKMAEVGVGLAPFYRIAAIAPMLAAEPLLEIGVSEPGVVDGSQATVVALLRLQNEPDYRRALRDWFRPVRTGGHLIVVVPHAFLHERQLALPSRWHPRQRRLYTPASLLDEVEEALPPTATACDS